jgi:hypothetical protein
MVVAQSPTQSAVVIPAVPRGRFRALAESQLYEEYNVSVGQESRLGRGRKAREQKEKKIEDGSGKQSDVQRPRVER